MKPARKLLAGMWGALYSGLPQEDLPKTSLERLRALLWPARPAPALKSTVLAPRPIPSVREFTVFYFRVGRIATREVGPSCKWWELEHQRPKDDVVFVRDRYPDGLTCAPPSRR